MNLNIIFPGALLACLATYIILVGGYRGSIKTLVGHSLLIPSLLWLSAATAALYVSPVFIGVMPVFGVVKMLGIGLFFHQLHPNKKPFLIFTLGGTMLLGFLLSMALENRAQATQLFAAAGLGVCLTLLSWNEMLYRESEHAAIKSKPVFFATGILLTVDFVWFTDALIDGEFSNTIFYVRGVVLLLMLPLILKGLFSLQLSPLKLRASRSAVFHGSILMLCGVYLLIIGGVTSGLQWAGLKLESASDVVVLAVLVTPLSVVFVSTRLRRLVRVKISKHLFSEQFDYRRVWLQFASTLHLHATSGSNTTFNALLEILHHKKGAYASFSHGRLRLLTSQGDVPEMLLAQTKPLLPFLVSSEWVLDREEAQNNPEQYPIDVSNVMQNFPMRWVIPVVEKKTLMGVLFLDEHDSGVEPWVMNWELKDFLLTVATQWHWHVQAKENAEKLAQTAQLATFTQTAAFVLHDLKNVDTQMAMLVSNAKNYGHDPDFVSDAFTSLEHIHTRLQKVLRQLSAKQYTGADKSAQRVTCELSTFYASIQQIPEWHAVTTHSLQEPAQIHIDVSLEKLVNVCAHLLRNALDACAGTKRHAEIKFSCDITQEDVIIRIEDNGCGMSSTFVREQLFKPLETTKGNSGMGLGVFDAKQFAQQHHGDLLVRSRPGEGTEFSLCLPKGLGHDASIPS